MEHTITNHYIAEQAASFMYLTAANRVHLQGFNGVAKYFYKMSAEERGHAQMVAEYCSKRGFSVEPKDIPLTELGETIESIFSKVLEAENYIMACLMEIYETACKNKDFPTEVFMQEMIKEQTDGVDEARTNYRKCCQYLTANDPIGFDAYISELV